MEIQTDFCNGTVERVVFQNTDNGFSVLRIKARGHADLITVVGLIPHVTPGELIECRGSWDNHRDHGRQFKAAHVKVIPPSTLEGIEKYLGSGLIRGIGPHFAKQLIKVFGEQVLDVIDQMPERLIDVPGIGEVRQACIKQAWAEQKVVRNIMLFLQQHGVGTARAVRIYKTYGDQAIEKIKQNPYTLSLDIHGIGFKTADGLAQRLGIARDALIRVQAGLRHILLEFSTMGHCAAYHEDLLKSTAELIEVSPELVEQAIEAEVREKNIVADSIQEKTCYFLANFYRAELSVVKDIRRLQQGAPIWLPMDIEKAIPWAEAHTSMQLSPSQQQAIRTVLQSKVSIITGGPGVGKTTIVNVILSLLRQKRVHITLCAPTGRAAKRMAEATGLEAKTIHRLLGRKPNSSGFQFDNSHPLQTDFLVVDETSMIDIVLLQHLLRAISSRTAVLLVGDVDQLPSVGPGAALSDLIASAKITTVRLTEIFRQAASSQIIVNAHRINHGDMPFYYEKQETLSDFYFIRANTPEEIQQKLLSVVTNRIPQRFKFHPIHDIQVLTPMNRGLLGARALNLILQQNLNGAATAQVTRFGTTFFQGDKIIQTVNNYDKEVFNGDVGFIQTIDLEEGQVVIQFDERRVNYQLDDLDEVSLAYAVTIHKSQGSEYPAVVIPIATQHFTLLERNLIYTAVTRGKKLVVVIGQPKALAIAVNTTRSQKRLTKLAERLATQESAL